MRNTRTPLPTVALFLLPSFLGFAVFVLYPMIANIGYSLTNYSGGRNTAFVGLYNYILALQTEAFWSSLWITIKFVVISVVVQLFIGLVFALMLNSKFRGQQFFRSVLFLPSILSMVAISLAFMLMLNPSRGLVNSFLVDIGLPPSKWLSGKDTALGTIIFITIWQSFGYYMVIFLSGLQGISPLLYESADIDGANWWQKLKSITLPMLTPTTFFCVTMAIIRGFQVFDQVFILTGGMTGGGPAGATNVLVFEIYKNAFSQFRIGYASAEATILLIIVLAITLIQYKQQNRWVSYDL
jgi:multiple sugar transport system permease protein